MKKLDLPTLAFLGAGLLGGNAQAAAPNSSAQDDAIIKEYQKTFGLANEDTHLYWLRQHIGDYKELVKLRDEICKANGLDPSHYKIKLEITDSDNAGLEVGSAESREPKTIYFNTGFFTGEITGSKFKGYTREDRKAVMAHEIGHDLCPYNGDAAEKWLNEWVEKNTPTFFTSDNLFTWKNNGGGVNGYLDQANSIELQARELSADACGAQLSGGDIQGQVNFLNKVKLTSPNNTDESIKKSVERGYYPAHPGIETRVKMLQQREKEIKELAAEKKKSGWQR